MSAADTHQSARVTQLCRRCLDRVARARRDTVAQEDADRTLCFACYRVQQAQPGAGLPARDSAERPCGLPFDCDVRAHLAATRTPQARLSARQLEHRRRMLAHLESALRAAAP